MDSDTHHNCRSALFDLKLPLLSWTRKGAFMQRTPLLPNVFMDLVLTIAFLLGVTACTASNLSTEPATTTSMPATSLALATSIREPSPPPNCSQLEITQLLDNFAKAY